MKGVGGQFLTRMIIPVGSANQDNSEFSWREAAVNLPKYPAHFIERLALRGGFGSMFLLQAIFRMRMPKVQSGES